MLAFIRADERNIMQFIKMLKQQKYRPDRQNVLARFSGYMRVMSWLLGLICIMFVTTASASNIDIQGIRFGQIDSNGQSATRMVIETSRPARAQLLMLENPYRLVVDIENAQWAVRSLPPSKSVSQGVVNGYRFGYPESNIGRIVLELASPARPLDAFRLPPRDGGHRLVVDVAATSATQFLMAKTALLAEPFFILDDTKSEPAQTAQKKTESDTSKQASAVPIAPPARPKLPARQNSTPKKWIVAIDAGHGGKDPGTIGLKGTREKHITLMAAQMLSEALKKTGKVTPVLVRSKDVYYKLRHRIKLAHDARADLFVSLHADSAKSKKAHGISVFTLSDTASDKEAEYLARNENKADLIGGPDLAGEDPVAASELLRMFQRQSMNQSSQLAASILSHIKDFPGSDKRGHRFAGFAVLKSPDIPSVLVEMGFLSNRQDEANLNDTAYLRKLSRRLSSAILSYLENSGS